MESQAYQTDLELVVKRNKSLVEDASDNELSTDNSLVSIDKLTSTSSQINAEQVNQDLPPSPPLVLTKSEAPSTSETHSKCLYCDTLVAKELMSQHKDTCDKRTIVCEACNETVDLDIFDFHLEICSAQTQTHGGYYYQQDFYQQAYQADNQPLSVNEQAPESLQDSENVENHQESENPEVYQGEPNENGSNEEGEENFEDGEDEDLTYEEMIGFDPSVMTYEQLMLLDNTIIKKGMTEEEMKQFPAEVYLKEFDGVCGCAVCISEYESGEITRKLNCGHKFHRDCIDTWLSENITCPVCKKYLR